MEASRFIREHQREELRQRGLLAQTDDEIQRGSTRLTAITGAGFRSTGAGQRATGAGNLSGLRYGAKVNLSRPYRTFASTKADKLFVKYAFAAALIVCGALVAYLMYLAVGNGMRFPTTPTHVARARAGENNKEGGDQVY